MAAEASSRPRGRGLAAIGLALIGLALAATPAGATTIYTHPFISSFDGAGSQGSGGPTGPLSTYEVDHIAIDSSSEAVYVIDTGRSIIDKFGPTGNPVAFSALGAGINSITVPEMNGAANLAVDNSGTGSQGQIYAFGEGHPAHAYSPTGTQLGGNFPLAPPGDTCGGATDPQGNFWWGWNGGGAVGYNSAGFPLNKTLSGVPSLCHFAINSAQPPSPTSGYFYIAGYGGGQMHVYDAAGNPKYEFEAGSTLGWAVDAGGGSASGDIYVNNFDHITEWAPSTTETPGPMVSNFGGPDPVHGFPSGIQCGGRGIAVNPNTHNVYVGDCGKVDIFGPGQPLIIPTVTIKDADVTPTTAVLKGEASTDGGGDTTNCRFEYGTNTSYGTVVPCASPSGPIHDADGTVPVASEEITFLEPGQLYHFRLVVTNSNGVSFSADRTFKPEGPPVVSNVFASEVNTDSARLTGTIDPSGGDTRYRFDYGPTSAYGHSIPLPDFKLIDIHAPTTVTQVLHGLEPGTTFHYRLVATNPLGPDDSGDKTLSTFADDSFADSCPNAHVRRQTMTTLLLDCRAYELVSAADTGGYDVQTDLIPGQVTLPAYPRATDRVLYSLHHGKIPGIAGPTNLGLDPYVATRGPGGWTTTYVGIPTGAPPATEPFGSPLGQADDGLSTFAFGGASICVPCFADGKTGIPVHLPNGNLVQGMAGSLDPGPSAAPAGYVGRQLSADGTHLVFGSTSKFEQDGNSNGDISIYDRNLGTGVTHVVSKTTAGATMTGPGIGELDISGDGARILIGQAAAPDDSAGNHYWHLYMNIGDAGHSVDVTPGTTSGVLYDGMTSDGSRVAFTTADKLLAADTDSSPDLYEADISAAGAVTLTLVSTGTGGAGDTNGCTPSANLKGPHWNSVGAGADCGVVAFAGGSGVAAGDGTVYFLSPEKLDGSGTQDAPNLFVSRPGGAPHLVATLEPDNPAVLNAVRNNEVRSFADFQVTPSGDDAAFASSSSLTGFPNFGHSEIYRYDVASDSLDCASCPPTEAAPTTDTSLSSYGLNIDDAGAVFFTTFDQLVLRDSNKRADAYEWEGGTPQLISTGNAASDSGLVSVSADGVNAYFFTRQVLVPEDKNGAALKIYDARAGGGIPFDPPLLPCQASDECHGPGSQAAPPPDIGTFKGTGGNLKPTHRRHRHHPKRRHKHHGTQQRNGGHRHG
jgi:hypothetical protein